MLHERKLCSGSRRSKNIFASVYPVGNDTIFVMNVLILRSVLYKGERLHLIIRAGFSRKTASNVGLDVSFDNMHD